MLTIKFLTSLCTMNPAITCGNHELYHDSTVKGLQSGFIKAWKGRYLTANIHDSATGKLVGMST
jgi:hypothetical protein